MTVRDNCNFPRSLSAVSLALLAVVAGCDDDPDTKLSPDGGATDALIAPATNDGGVDALPPDGGAATGGARLVVADSDQDKLYVYAVPGWQLLAEVAGVRFDDHAGFLPLGSGRVAFIDGAAEELVILATAVSPPAIVARAKVAFPVAHIAADPNFEYVVASAGGKPTGTFSMVRLSDMAVKRASLATGEPGLALAGNPLHLYHRNDTPTQVEAYLFADLWQGSVPTPTTSVIGKAPHGEVIAHGAGKLLVAADDGINVLPINGQTFGATTVIPYNVNGRSGGRAYYARLSADGKYAYSYLRDAGPAGAWPWKDWVSDAYVIDIAAGAAKRIEIGKGLVYRLADSPRYALFVQYHPDGDFAHIMDTDSTSPSFQTIIAKVPLDRMSRTPGADESPWASVAFRNAGMTPDGGYGFVTHGGDGVVSVIDLTTRQVVHKINTPTKLNNGGYLLGVSSNAVPADTIGR